MKFLMFAILLAMSLPVAAMQVTAVQGKVQFQAGEGGFKDVQEGQSFKAATVFKTGRKSLAVVELSNGSKVKLNAQTTLRIVDKKDAEVRMDRGSGFFKFNKTPNHSLRVFTRSAVAGVRGTEFFTSYGTAKNSEDVWLCVNEGTVEVENLNTKSKKKVNAGEGIGIRKGKETSEPQPLAWTQKLNWNMDSDKGDLENTVDIESAYTDLLDQDYD